MLSGTRSVVRLYRLFARLLPPPPLYCRHTYWITRYRAVSKFGSRHTGAPFFNAEGTRLALFESSKEVLMPTTVGSRTRNVTSIDPWYLQNLICPIDRTPFTFDGARLISQRGRAYPIVDGVPVLLVDNREPTIDVARLSIARAQGRA